MSKLCLECLQLFNAILKSAQVPQFIRCVAKETLYHPILQSHPRRGDCATKVSLHDLSRFCCDGCYCTILTKIYTAYLREIVMTRHCNVQTLPWMPSTLQCDSQRKCTGASIHSLYCQIATETLYHLYSSPSPRWALSSVQFPKDEWGPFVIWSAICARCGPKFNKFKWILSYFMILVIYSRASWEGKNKENKNDDEDHDIIDLRYDQTLNQRETIWTREWRLYKLGIHSSCIWTKYLWCTFRRICVRIQGWLVCHMQKGRNKWGSESHRWQFSWALKGSFSLPLPSWAFMMSAFCVLGECVILPL